MKKIKNIFLWILAILFVVVGPILSGVLESGFLLAIDFIILFGFISILATVQDYKKRRNILSIWSYVFILCLYALFVLILDLNPDKHIFVGVGLAFLSGFYIPLCDYINILYKKRYCDLKLEGKVVGYKTSEVNDRHSFSNNFQTFSVGYPVFEYTIDKKKELFAQDELGRNFLLPKIGDKYILHLNKKNQNIGYYEKKKRDYFSYILQIILGLVGILIIFAALSI